LAHVIIVIVLYKKLDNNKTGNDFCLSAVYHLKPLVPLKPRPRLRPQLTNGLR